MVSVCLSVCLWFTLELNFLSKRMRKLKGIGEERRGEERDDFDA